MTIEIKGFGTVSSIKYNFFTKEISFITGTVHSAPGIIVIGDTQIKVSECCSLDFPNNHLVIINTKTGEVIN